MYNRSEPLVTWCGVFFRQVMMCTMSKLSQRITPRKTKALEPARSRPLVARSRRSPTSRSDNSTIGIINSTLESHRGSRHGSRCGNSVFPGAVEVLVAPAVQEDMGSTVGLDADKALQGSVLVLVPDIRW